MSATIKNDVQLAYFIQGYFEISGGTEFDPLTEKQAKQIVSKILRMKERGKVADMVLAHLKLDDDLNVTHDLVTASRSIERDLNKMFQHDIDPSYAGDQNSFNAAHHGNRPPREPGMRC